MPDAQPTSCGRTLRCKSESRLTKTKPLASAPVRKDGLRLQRGRPIVHGVADGGEQPEGDRRDPALREAVPEPAARKRHEPAQTEEAEGRRCVGRRKLQSFLE